MKLSELEEKEIVIYGTGHVGHKFLRVLRQHGLEHQICCFAVTKRPGAESSIEGIPVYGIQDILVNKNTLVCLAVHDSLREELEREVRRVTEQYVWIYPNLYGWIMGEAEQTEVWRETAALLQNYRKDFRLAVRLAAIEQQEGKNSFGFDYYIRAQMLHCDAHTARKRIERFRKLIAVWNEADIQNIPPLSLNQNNEVIDGNHRLALAVYHGQRKVLCNIYSTELSAEEIHGLEAMLVKETVRSRGIFSPEEIRALDKIQKQYFLFY